MAFIILVGIMANMTGQILNGWDIVYRKSRLLLDRTVDQGWIGEREPAILAGGDIVVRVSDTGIGMRNTHMRENHLETETYPVATFTGGRIPRF